MRKLLMKIPGVKYLKRFKVLSIPLTILIESFESILHGEFKQAMQLLFKFDSYWLVACVRMYKWDRGIKYLEEKPYLLNYKIFNFYSGILYQGKGQHFMACMAFEKAINEGYTYNANIFKCLSMSYKKMEKYNSAIELYNEYLAIKKAEASDYFYLADLYLTINDVDNANGFFQKFSEKSDDISIWEMYYKKNDWYRTLEFLDQDSSARVDLNYYKARIYFFMFNFKEAKNILEEDIQNNPSDESLYLLGRVNEHLEDFTSAKECYSKVLDIDNFDVSYRLAFSLYQLGEYKEACLNFKNVCNEYQINNEENKYSKEGERLELLGDIEASLISYKKALITSDYNHLMYIKIADLYFELGDFENAAYYYMSQRITRSDQVTYNGRSIVPGINKEVVYNSIFKDSVIDEDSIHYISYNGSSFSGNPYALFKETSINKKFKHYIAVNDINCVSDEVASLENVFIIKYGSVGHMQALSVAKYIITDTTLPFFFMAKEEQKILNTWHGTPMKKLGYEIEELGYFSSRNVARCLNISTHFINPNQFTEEALMKSYTLGYNGLTNYKVTGYPRIDLTVNATDELKASIRKRLNIEEGKKVVLYAPTYRGNNNASDGRELPEIDAAKKLLSNNGYHFLFKGHYFGAEDNAAINSIDSNELLSIVDVLISDYSSIALDFLPMDKPIIYYNFDNEQYSRERGMYFPLTDISDLVVQDANELKVMVDKLIDNPNIDNKQLAAKEKFCSLEDGNSSKRVLDFFFGDSKAIKSDKKQILIAAPNLGLVNGMTTAMLNFVDRFDKSKYDITLLLIANHVGENKDYPIIEQLYEAGCKIIIDFGKNIVSAEENFARKALEQKYCYYSKKHEQIVSNIFDKHAKRIFSNVEFDAVINYNSGYDVRVHELLTAVKSKDKFIILHNDMLAEKEVKYASLQRAFRSYDLYDKIFSVSNSVTILNRDKLASKYNIDPSKFEELKNFIDYEKINRLSNEEMDNEDLPYFDNEYTFITLGRLSPEKNHKLAIESFKVLSDKFPNKSMKFLIFGEGPMKKETSSIINDLGLSDKVLLMGVRSNPFPLLKASDCFLFPSIHEGQGLVLFEALLCDTPIITSDFETSVEIVDEYGGKYVANDVELYSQALVDYINNDLDLSFNFNPEKYNEEISKKLFSYL